MSPLPTTQPPSLPLQETNRCSRGSVQSLPILGGETHTFIQEQRTTAGQEFQKFQERRKTRSQSLSVHLRKPPPMGQNQVSIQCSPAPKWPLVNQCFYKAAWCLPGSLAGLFHWSSSCSQCATPCPWSPSRSLPLAAILWFSDLFALEPNNPHVQF